MDSQKYMVRMIQMVRTRTPSERHLCLLCLLGLKTRGSRSILDMTMEPCTSLDLITAFFGVYTVQGEEPDIRRFEEEVARAWRNPSRLERPKGHNYLGQLLGSFYAIQI